jgi:hypothetical protein
MATTEEMFLNIIQSKPTRKVSEFARDLSVDRSRVYQLLRKHRYTKIGGQWVTSADIEQQGDLLFQMVSEMHEAIVSGRKLAVHVDLPASSEAKPVASTPDPPVELAERLSEWQPDRKRVNVLIPYHGSVLTNTEPWEPLIAEAVETLQHFDTATNAQAKRAIQLMLDALLIRFVRPQLKSNN